MLSGTYYRICHVRPCASGFGQYQCSEYGSEIYDSINLPEMGTLLEDDVDIEPPVEDIRGCVQHEPAQIYFEVHDKHCVTYTGVDPVDIDSLFTYCGYEADVSETATGFIAVGKTESITAQAETLEQLINEWRESVDQFSRFNTDSLWAYCGYEFEQNSYE